MGNRPNVRPSGEDADSRSTTSPTKRCGCSRVVPVRLTGFDSTAAHRRHGARCRVFECRRTGEGGGLTGEGAKVSDHSGADEVASGVPYSVTAVNGRVPGSLDDFGTDIVEVVASRREQRVTICGAGRRVDDRSVVIHEKTYDGSGKDVRTWEITGDADRFEATELSIF